MNKQRGLGFIGWLIALVFVGFCLTIFLKIFPVYIEHFTVIKALDGAVAVENAKTMLLQDMRKHFASNLAMNNVEQTNANALAVVEGGITRVWEIHYEVRKHLL